MAFHVVHNLFWQNCFSIFFCWAISFLIFLLIFTFSCFIRWSNICPLWWSKARSCYIMIRCTSLIIRLLARFGPLRAQRFKINSITGSLPFEIKKWMGRLYLNPPWSLEHGISDEVRTVALQNNEFIAVFNICVLKWNSTWILLFAFHLLTLFTHFNSIIVVLLGHRKQVFVWTVARQYVCVRRLSLHQSLLLLMVRRNTCQVQLHEVWPHGW